MSRLARDKALDQLADMRRESVRMRGIINILARLHEGHLQTGTQTRLRVSAKTLKTAHDIRKGLENLEKRISRA